MVKGRNIWGIKRLILGKEFNILISIFVQGVGWGELGEAPTASIVVCKYIFFCYQLIYTWPISFKFMSQNPCSRVPKSWGYTIKCDKGCLNRFLRSLFSFFIIFHQESNDALHFYIWATYEKVILKCKFLSIDKRSLLEVDQER